VNYSKIYNIDFRELANLLTPPFLRKLKFIDFLEALLKPLEEVNFDFKIFRNKAIYKVTHNGQTVYLQAVLNDSYDNGLRRIYIDDVPIYDPLYIYPEANEKPVYIGKPYLYTAAEALNFSGFDFLVFVPVEYKPFEEKELEIFLTQIRSLINYYKLASKRYDIIFI
jgi:hypothetical protein